MPPLLAGWDALGPPGPPGLGAVGARPWCRLEWCGGAPTPLSKRPRYRSGWRRTVAGRVEVRQTPWAAGAQLGLTGTVWASSTTVTLTILVLVDAFDRYLPAESALAPPTSSGEGLALEPRAAVGVDAMRCAELIPTAWARAAPPARRWNSAPDAAPAECAGLPTSLAPCRGAARGHRSDAGALADRLGRQWCQ